MPESPPLPGFGQVDLEFDDGLETQPAEPPPSQTYGKKQLETLPPPSVHDDATRIVMGDLLSDHTPAPPALDLTGAMERSVNPTLRRSEETRIGALDDDLLAAARGEIDEAPPSSRNAPSASGVSARAGRVAAMRELYASGNADAALALAGTLDDADDAAPGAPGRGADSPDSSVCIEIAGEVEIDDPYGGLIPVDEDAPPEEPSDSAAVHALGSLTLTQRQSIPRLLKTKAEIARLPIDHRSGFLLGFVDGRQTVAELLDVCAMPVSEALELLQQLVALGVIKFE